VVNFWQYRCPFWMQSEHFMSTAKGAEPKVKQEQRVGIKIKRRAII